MNQEATIIYPNQLYRNHPGLSKARPVFLVEDPLFFSHFNFHQKKLLFHRVSMKAYQAHLEEKGFHVTALDSSKLSHTADIAPILSEKGVRAIFIAELDDCWLSARLARGCQQHEIAVNVLPSPAFLTPLTWSEEFFSDKKDYFQTSYYIAQRKRLGILLDAKGPSGGSWTFDKENRKKLPKGHTPPTFYSMQENSMVREQKTFVQQRFGNNPGRLDGVFYPTTFAETDAWLDEFIETRLRLFGDYQDALSVQESFLYHSLLSAALNSGLLTPQSVLDTILQAHEKKAIPLNSLEGFIRQIIGWREYVRFIYNAEGSKQRTTNYFGFTRKIPRSFWTGTTGIEPIDTVITRALDSAYANHIERLMLLGNFMLLCEFDPDEVYQWFMELFIDAYDWVMVPNVYGMSQYADGGLITTKPYISSSNYIRKMSDFKRGDWCEVWDGLYWNFIDTQRTRFDGNPRMSLMLRQLSKMDQGKLSEHKKVADKFLGSL